MWHRTTTQLEAQRNWSIICNERWLKTFYYRNCVNFVTRRTWSIGTFVISYLQKCCWIATMMMTTMIAVSCIYTNYAVSNVKPINFRNKKKIEKYKIVLNEYILSYIAYSWYKEWSHRYQYTADFTLKHI